METVFATYTLREAFQLLDRHCQLPSKAKQSWRALFSYLATLDVDLQNLIQQDVRAHPGSKRKAPSTAAQPARRVKKPRLEPSSDEVRRNFTLLSGQDLIDSEFLSVPGPEVVHDCISRFIDRTSNQALSKKICVVCARNLPSREIEQHMLRSLPNKHLLKSTHPHAAHQLIDGLLLHETASPHQLNNICTTCLRNLRRCDRPKFSLGNNMWIGDVPFELSILTLPEQLLVSLYFPVAYIIKIYPKNIRNAGLSSQGPGRLNLANEKLKGNVSTFKLPASDIAEMVSGNLVPRPSMLLAATIGVTFVGVGKKALRCMPGLFRVRRQRVFDALMWLKRNNALYAEVRISEDRLRSLPEDDVPQEIMESVRYSTDVDAVGREHTGYATMDDDEASERADDEPGEPTELDGDVEQEENFLGIDDPTDTDDLIDNFDADPTVIDEEDGDIDNIDQGNFFTHLCMESLTPGGEGIPDATLFAHAVENFIPAPFAQDYGVRKGSAFVNEYARRDENHERFDGGPSNPNHLLGAFPMLFPYGCGGFEVDRSVKVTYEEHVRWALQHASGRFRHHTQFIFQVFGVLWKRQVCRSAALHIDHNQFIANYEDFMRLKPKDFLDASEEENLNVTLSNPTMRLLRQHITTVRAKVQDMGYDTQIQPTKYLGDDQSIRH
ncbi:ATP-dependent DNA helicase [Mycena indigotica]|uniref:ATP-dependent DNA helicase n=1 Tax=Mycena indigotica TaxID=2126181 RepID=A0A8H6SEI1_9AGAR|nr:ATP-dependent DNA helicase [Mycena indigotica]KAF7297472.1 ATP-dependent DNA helicase [Mycena indigotica]